MSLAWVPGHCDILGNEKADELAMKDTRTMFMGVVRNYAGNMVFELKMRPKINIKNMGKT